MHILIVTVTGLLALAVLSTGARLLGIRAASAASLFVWLWLVVAVVSGLFGVGRAGIPVINEVGAFVPIFGIPAAAAWLLIFRSRGKR